MRSAAGAVAPIGPTERPQGEEASGHGGTSEEVSPVALAKRAKRASVLCPSSEGLGATAPGADLKIVRATCKITLDLRRLSPLAKKGEARVVSDAERHVRKALDDAERWSATASNAVLRELWRRDTDALDAWQQEHGEQPRSKDWPAPRINVYQLARRAAPRLNTGIASVIARAVETKWRQVRFDALIRQKCSPPHYRVGLPIPCRASECAVLADGPRYALRVALYDGRGCRLELPMDVRDGRQREQLAALAAGQWKLGNLALQRDRRNRAKWYVRIAYTRLQPRRTEGRSAAINRGLHTFLAAVIDRGEAWIYDGNDIEAYLKQVQRRRREYQRDSKASRRWGHGRKRTLRAVEPLAHKAANYRRTKCQTIARRLATWLAERDVRTVYVEDFTAIRGGEPERTPGGKWLYDRIQQWPYYDLQQRLTSCCEEAGIEVVCVGADYISQRCPKCSHTDPSHRDLRRWRLRCSQCDYARHLDVAAAENVLARGRVLHEAAVGNDTRNVEGASGETGPLAKRGRTRRKHKGPAGRVE